MEYTVTLPLPPRTASPNRPPRTVRDGIHRNQDRAAYREACISALRAARVPPCRGLVTVDLDFYLSRGKTPLERYQLSDRYQPTDDDNAVAAFKAGRDALRIAGVIVDDASRYLRIGRVRLLRGADNPDRRACIVLTIQETPTCPNPSTTP